MGPQFCFVSQKWNVKNVYYQRVHLTSLVSIESNMGGGGTAFFGVGLVKSGLKNKSIFELDLRHGYITAVAYTRNF